MEHTLKLFRSPNLFSPAIELISTTYPASSSHCLNPLVDINPTSTFLWENDPSLLIPKIKYSKPTRDLRLVIHGSSGGEVHHLIKYLVNEVQRLRGTHVDLEALTQENPMPSSSSSIWLIPLFLLPGKHVQNDIPKIFRRLSNQGICTKLIPFLGSWSYWISILKYFVNLNSRNEKPILLHHPINSGEYGHNYLKNLNSILKIPIISWTQWHEFSDRSDKTYTPIPFSLAPNKNTKGLRNSDSMSSLLDIDLFMFNLIKILTLLP